MYPRELSLLAGYYIKRLSILKFSGNEVYYTACYLQVILNDTFRRLYYQMFFKLKVFLYEIVPGYLWLLSGPRLEFCSVQKMVMGLRFIGAISKLL